MKLRDKNLTPGKVMLYKRFQDIKDNLAKNLAKNKYMTTL